MLAPKLDNILLTSGSSDKLSGGDGSKNKQTVVTDYNILLRHCYGKISTNELLDGVFWWTFK